MQRNKKKTREREKEKEVLKAHVSVYTVAETATGGFGRQRRGLAYINNNVCNGLGGPLLSQPYTFFSSLFFFFTLSSPTLSSTRRSVCVCVGFLATVPALFFHLIRWWFVLTITSSPVIKNSMTTACGILKNAQRAYIIPCCYHPPPFIAVVLRHG